MYRIFLCPLHAVKPPLYPLQVFPPIFPVFHCYAVQAEEKHHIVRTCAAQKRFQLFIGQSSIANSFVRSECFECFGIQPVENVLLFCGQNR